MKLAPRCKIWPPGVNLSLMVKVLCSPIRFVTLFRTKAWAFKVYPWGPSSPLGANFTPRGKLMLLKTGLWSRQYVFNPVHGSWFLDLLIEILSMNPKHSFAILLFSIYIHMPLYVGTRKIDESVAQPAFQIKMVLYNTSAWKCLNTP
jgi:hypothetical protein